MELYYPSFDQFAHNPTEMGYTRGIIHAILQ